jgi:hypothetical protein
MGCRNCVGASCNPCLLKRTVKTGLVFFVMSTSTVCAVTGNNAFVRTLIFMAIIFLLMKLSKMRSGYVIRDENDMSKPHGSQLLFEGADF